VEDAPCDLRQRGVNHVSERMEGGEEERREWRGESKTGERERTRGRNIGGEQVNRERGCK
jgi:hypothetical protein